MLITRIQFSSLFIFTILFAVLSGLYSSAQNLILDPPTLVFPPNGVILQNPNEAFDIQLQWTPVANAEYYQVNYTIRIDGNPVLFPPHITTDTTFTITLTPDDMLDHIQVNWSVLSVAEGYTTSAPNRSSFTVGTTGTPLPDFLPTPTPLSAPQLIDPENGSEIDAIQPVTFRWSPLEEAISYEYQIYDDSQTIRFPGSTSFSEIDLTLAGIPFVQKVYQWRVRALDEEGRTGYWSNRNWFRITKLGSTLPTPTPLALSIDLNGDGTINAQDLFLFASRYQTNDPTVDFNHNGINDAGDLLFFVRFLPQQEPPLIPSSAMLKPE